MGKKCLFTSDANLAGAFLRESALLRNDQDTPNFPASTSPPEGSVLPHLCGIDTVQKNTTPLTQQPTSSFLGFTPHQSPPS